MKLYPTKKLKTPEECLKTLWKWVPVYIRWTFCSAVILGFGTHLFVFTNKYTNHDDLSQMFQASYGTASGRWLLPAAARLDGDFSIPWLIGVLSILCLAGIACFSVSVLRIRSPLGCTLTAALLVTFPTAASTFAYMFSADTYFLSLLLATIGAWAAVKRQWWGSVLGALAITLSIGIYQAYFPVTAALMVGALLLETLDGEKPFRDLFLKGLRLVGTLAAGLAGYMVMVRITTWNTGLTTYQGIDRMGIPSLEEIPDLIQQAYSRYPSFFLENDLNWHFGFLQYAFLFITLGSIVLLLLVLWRKRPGAAQIALAVALTVIYPLAADLIYLLAPYGFMHTLMIYGLVYILILPIALIELAQPVLRETRAENIHTAVSWVVFLSLALAAYSYAVTDNNAYLKADLSLRQCEAYSNRLVERIESCEGYCPGMVVILVGSEEPDWTLTPVPALTSLQMVGIFDLQDFRTQYAYPYFLKYYSVLPGLVYWGDTYEAKACAELEEVQAMPLYPQAGSVQVVDGAVVVKLNG